MEARMSVINPNACGIDVGSKMHYVATGQGSEEVRSFGVYTKDHQEMVAYLQSKGVETIAMESTGNYWQTLFTALEKAGFEVFLVTSRVHGPLRRRSTQTVETVE